MDDASIPRLPSGVRLHEDKVRGSWTLLGPERVFQLDDISVEILKRCTGDAALGAIEQDLAETFDAEVSEILY